MYTILYNIKFLTFTKHKNVIDVQNTAEPAQIGIRLFEHYQSLLYNTEN